MGGQLIESGHAASDWASLKVLIVGLGSIGRRHARNLRRLGAVQLSAYRTRLGALREDDLPGIRVFDSLQAALRSGPDAVFVTNPTSLHLAVAREAVEAGCHLFVEKPIAANLDGVEQLLAQAAARQVHVAVGYDMRFNRALRALKRRLTEGGLGRVMSAHFEVGSYLPAWHKWEDYRVSYAARADLGGGVLRTLSHEVDLARWLLGEVESVSAETAHLSALQIDVEDVAGLLLRFAGGHIATVHLDYVQYPPRRRLRIVGDEAVVEWDEKTGLALSVGRDGTEDILDRDDASPEQPFVDEVGAFLRIITGGDADGYLADGRDGERALGVIAAAEEAARSGRRARVPGVEQIVGR